MSATEDLVRPGRRSLLVVEDDADTANLLAVYFGGFDYDVAVAARGAEALAQARRRAPDLVLLDIGLPDMDGYQVCAGLRASPRTSHLPVIFLSERTSLEDRVTGLSAGAQDYVTKPFDLDELRLRIQNLVARAAREHVVDPRTHLPTGPWTEEQRRHLRGQAGWHRLECRIDAYRPFVDLNGFVAGDNVLAFAGSVLREVLEAHGTPEDFIGHPAHDTFVVLTQVADPAALAQRLQQRFDEGVQAHYSFLDSERGFVLIRDAGGQEVPAPLMTLQVSIRPEG